MKRILLCTAIFLAAAASAKAATVFSDDFDGVVSSDWSGSFTIRNDLGFDGVGGFSGNMLWNGTVNPAVATQLDLSGLAAHTELSLDFLFAAVDSWDPGDSIFIEVDDTIVAQATISNMTGVYSVPASFVNVLTGQPAGFNPGFPSSIWQVSLIIPHTAATAVIELYAGGAGWQGGADESWAIDNFVVSSNADAVVPVPASGLLLLSGLGLLAAVRRRAKA